MGRLEKKPNEIRMSQRVERFLVATKLQDKRFIDHGVYKRILIPGVVYNNKSQCAETFVMIESNNREAKITKDDRILVIFNKKPRRSLFSGWVRKRATDFRLNWWKDDDRTPVRILERFILKDRKWIEYADYTMMRRRQCFINDYKRPHLLQKKNTATQKIVDRVESIKHDIDFYMHFGRVALKGQELENLLREYEVLEKRLELIHLNSMELKLSWSYYNEDSAGLPKQRKTPVEFVDYFARGS